MTSNADHTISILTSSLGPWLTPMIGILALYSTELNEPLISKSKEMLKIIASIQQQIESSSRYDKPWVDPETNQPHINANGIPKLFIPSSCREKCLVQATGPHNNDPEILEVLKSADTEWEACRVKMAGFSKSISKLEIKNRQKQLILLVYDLTTTYTFGMVIIKQTRTNPFGLTFDRKDLPAKEIYDAFDDLSTKLATFLVIPAEETIQGDFAKQTKFDNPAIESNFTESDSQFIKDISTELDRSIPAITIRYRRATVVGNR
jgi:hypothetical protein